MSQIIAVFIPNERAKYDIQVKSFPHEKESWDLAEKWIVEKAYEHKFLVCPDIDGGLKLLDYNQIDFRWDTILEEDE